MIRSFLIEPVPDELSQGQRIGHAPRNPALGIDAFKVTDQQHSEVHARSNAGPTIWALVVPAAEMFTMLVEPARLEQSAQPVIERIRRCSNNLSPRDPQRLLALPLPACSHGHASLCSD